MKRFYVSFVQGGSTCDIFTPLNMDSFEGFRAFQREREKSTVGNCIITFIKELKK